MKKALFVMGMTFSASGMFAQGGAATTTPTTTTVTSTTPNIVSKKGEMYLPQTGDWAISMDATPWLNYLGNMLSSHGNSAPYASFLNNNQTIIGKYFVDDHTAYRALVRIGFNSNSINHEVNGSSTTDTAFPTPQVEDKRTISSHFIGLGVGMEKRRGNTRLQGYYGAEFMFYLSGGSTSMTYGNAYNATTNPTPVWTNNFDSSTTSMGLGTPGVSKSGGRTTQIQLGSTFGINLVGFIGFEYFFAPKISIGGEYTWGLGYQTTGQTITSVEELTKSSADVVNTYKSGGGSGFSLDSGINSVWGNSSMGSGNLYINFHF